MWGATFVSTKVLLHIFIPVEVLFTRAVLAFLAMFPGLLFRADQKDCGVGLFDHCRDKADLFLRDPVSDPVLIVEHASWNPEVLASRKSISNFLFLDLAPVPVDFCAGIWQPSGSAWCGPACIFMFSPIVTVVLSVLILHEKVTMVSVFGALLILAGLAISQKKTGGSR